MKVRLLLVDDHPIVRSGMKMLFQAEPDLEIVGEADGGAEAIVAVQRLHPDVVIMDVAMPGMNGIEATRRIKELAPETAVLALTMHEDEQYFFEMLKAGASGYIPKRAAPDDLVAAVRVVSQGNVFLYATLARFLMKDMVEQETVDETAGAAEDDSLSAREREVLDQLLLGLHNRDVAERLGISPRTVEVHKARILDKLGARNVVDLLRRIRPDGP